MKTLIKNLEVVCSIPTQTSILKTLYKQVKNSSVLWRSQDLNTFDECLVSSQIDFAESHIYGISDDPTIVSAW